jgi:hypothetical protein
MGSIETGLDKILSLWLGDEGLEFCSGEGVDEPRLGDDEQKNLGAGEGGQFVGLGGWLRTMRMDKSGINVTFFIMPVNRHVRRE